MLDNIPGELRTLPQWVVSGPNKLPINARTGQAASVDDPTSWSTFHEARQAGYQNVGFVLTAADPYTIIDLDDPITEDQAARHGRIFQLFTSYSELSQSGKGVHIIVRGRVAAGRRKDKVEVYSEGRYMICTGNVLNASPITEHQELLDILIAEMPVTLVAGLSELAASVTDERLYDIAFGAQNGDKFSRLWHGDMTGYPSQSEADFALLTILCFYSKSNDQVRRVFRYSELGKRDKAQRNDDYLDRALGKIRAKQEVPMVDLTALLSTPLPPPPPMPAQPYLPFSINDLADSVVPALPPPPPLPQPTLMQPPGLVGAMSDYIYSSAIRPVQEVGLTAALALAGGILGRHYNISSTGLNQYIVLLAGTGTGKEGAAGGIDALLASIRDQVPAADEFVGPGTFASGQALTRVLDKKPCFVSVLGEIGLTLQQICDPKAGAHNVQLRKVLLDIYAKSGFNKWLRPSVYSDQDKNTGIVRAPNVTILGESTPENFYGALQAEHIAEGLVPRFLVIEYQGLRPPSNPNAFHRPSPALVAQLTATCQTVLTMQNNDTCCPVQIDRYASSVLDCFNVFADDQINATQADSVCKQLWNRADLKARKLAALVAVGCNVHQPIVTKEVASWAVALVERDIANMTAKFTEGVIGQGDHSQEMDIRKACEKYPQLTAEQREQYKVPKCLVDKGNLLPYTFLKRYLVQRASFKNDRRGAVTAIQVALKDMLNAGTLAQIPPTQAKSELAVDSPVYYRGEAW